MGMATQLTLTLLGLAIGVWSINLKAAEPVGGVPIGAGSLYRPFDEGST